MFQRGDNIGLASSFPNLASHHWFTLTDVIDMRII